MFTVCTLNKMRWEWYFTSVIFFSQIHNRSLIMRKKKKLAKSPYRDNVQNTWPVYLKKIIKTKKFQETVTAMRNLRSHDQLREMWYSGINTEHHRLDGHGFGWTPGVGDGQGGLACCGSWGCRVGQDWATELNWTEGDFNKLQTLVSNSVSILVH